MLPLIQLDQAIERTIREEWGRILAALVKSLGDLQLAEDVLQDAVTIALENWKVQGLPRSPAAWLLQTSRRKAIDRFRKDQRFTELQDEIAYLTELEHSADELELDEAIPDKRLELIFTCCHPSLEEKTRVALTLRTLGGLTTQQIARTFLDKPATIAQRLARAKKKIAVAGIPYQVPAAEMLPARLTAVLSVIYFMFNEGYSASSGSSVTRNELADEAIRLARITHQLMPDETEVAGLLALMLLHDSRRYARQGQSGEFVSLEKQNRKRWDRKQIEEGIALLKHTLQQQKVGPYQLQAAISAVHAEAENWQATDWPQISALYGLLYSMQPSAVIQINQAVALSYSHSIETGLALLQALQDEPAIANYQPYYATLADLLLRAGKTAAAKKAFEQAIELSDNDVEKAFLQMRSAGC